MKNYLAIIAAIGITVVAWGVYGPTLHKGQMAMKQSRLRPLICVGLAYFVIAVVIPTVLLAGRGESGEWTVTGTIWSLAAGSAGAIGALGIIMAFNYGGSATYVMPLVFGCAPVVNAFLSIYLAGTWREFKGLQLPFFLAGLILVAVGGFTVLFTAPKPKAHAAAAPLEPAPVSPVESPAPSP